MSKSYEPPFTISAQALAEGDGAGQATGFIEFMLATLLAALQDAPAADQVTDQVKALLRCLGDQVMSAMACLRALGLRHRPTFRQNVLNPALAAGLIERTRPDKPRSRLQSYRCVRPV
jgi:hypothetical protein